jgi:hypothetical protein
VLVSNSELWSRFAVGPSLGFQSDFRVFPSEHNCDIGRYLAVLQVKNRSDETFSQRTDALARRTGLPLNELHRLTGISPRMLYAYRSGKQRITRKAWLKLETAEVRAGIAVADPISQSPPAHQPQEEPPTPSRRTHESAPIPRANPPTFEPTEEDCRAYLAGYLDEAAGVPGAVGHVWIQLNTHLPRDLLRRLKPAAAGPPASGAALAALGFSPEEIRRARRDADEALRRTDAAAASPRDERRQA